MSRIYAKDSRSKEVSTGPATAADPPSSSCISHSLKPSLLLSKTNDFCIFLVFLNALCIIVSILFQNAKQRWYLPFLAPFLYDFPCYFLNALKAKPPWYIAFAAVCFALVFKTLLDASRAAPKSSPRGCRGISCPLFGHGWTHCCAFDPPASPEDNDFSSYAGHFFQELSSTLSLDFLSLFGYMFGLVFAPSTPYQPR